MLSRRNLLAAGAALPLSASSTGAMFLCMHQTTSAAAGFRASLEGYSRAGIRYVELTRPLVEEFVRREGIRPARRLLGDLGLKPVSLGSVVRLEIALETTCKACPNTDGLQVTFMADAITLAFKTVVPRA